jgi:hypothetical protein
MKKQNRRSFLKKSSATVSAVALVGLINTPGSASADETTESETTEPETTVPPTHVWHQDITFDVDVEFAAPDADGDHDVTDAECRNAAWGAAKTANPGKNATAAAAVDEGEGTLAPSPSYAVVPGAGGGITYNATTGKYTIHAGTKLTKRWQQ